MDDDPDVRAVVASALRPDYEVVEAMDGLDALHKIENYQPDFAIIDAIMPLMDGFELCESIRRHDQFRAIPVIFLSAHSRQEDIKKGYASGANLYLTKPIDPLRVIKNIEFTIDHDRLHPRPKRHTIGELKEIDQLNKRRAAEAPPPPPPPPRYKPERRQWNLGADEEPEPEPVRPARAERFTPPPVEEEELVEAQIEDEAFEYEPAGEEMRPQPGEDTEEVQMPDGPAARIMIVENEDDSRELMELTLRRTYEVTTARDGLEAVQNIVQYQPDILMIDIMMPRMNGYQLLQSLRRNPAYKKLPVIVVSAKASKRDREYVERLGANAFVAKPFDVQDLLDAVAVVTSDPEFKIAAKRIPIVEIVEQEFLRAKDKQDAGSQKDRVQKFSGLKEAMQKESQRRQGG